MDFIILVAMLLSLMDSLVGGLRQMSDADVTDGLPGVVSVSLGAYVYSEKGLTLLVSLNPCSEQLTPFGIHLQLALSLSS